MPAAVLIGGLVAIALAFAAISATLLIRQLVVNPVRGAAIAVAEIAIVGGVVSWALTQLANIIEAGLGGMAYLAEVGKQQAADWWNYLVNQTVASQFAWYFGWVGWLASVAGAIGNVLNNFPTLWSLTVYSLAPKVQATESSLAGLQNFVFGQLWQTLSGIGNDLAGLHSWIDNYELPLIRGIGNDLAGLRDWVGRNAATHSEVVQAEAQAIATARALAVPIEAAIRDIENSPCMKTCDVLGDLGQLLQGLEDAGMAAILIALIEQALHDPGTVVSEIESDLLPPIKDALASFQLGIPG